MCKLWHNSNSTNTVRYGTIIMRKSERLLNLELEIYKLRIELDLVYDILNNLVAASEAASMESGKWYVRKPRFDSDN